MDFADIKRCAEAAREFQAEVGGLQFTLRLPTQHEVEVEASRVRLHEGDADPAMLLRLRRLLVQRAVVAWSGVTAEHLAPGCGAEAVDISPAAVGLLLDARSDVTDLLYARFVQERAARLEKQDAAEKNS